MDITSYIRFIFAITIFFCIAANAVNEEEIKRHSLSLEQKKELIAALSANIAEARGKETKIEKKLRTLEVSLGDKSNRIENLEVEAEKLKQKIENLEQEAKPIRHELKLQKAKLAQHFRLSYFIGRRDLLSMLFNEVGNRKLIRSLSLNKYIRAKEVRLLKQHLQVLNRLEIKTRQITAEENKIQVNLEQQRLLHENLKQDAKQRFEVLNKIKLEIKDQKLTLTKHKSEARELTELIQKLKVSINGLPIEVKPDAPFASLKGKLLRPVKGAKYRKIADLDGVLFRTRSGDAVKAIAGGRVIFSDWLRGFGLMTIVDHGDGYMSLYGQNKSLYREKGEWVQKGDLLARVGNTGGIKQTGLYFDIRKNGKSIPLRGWL